MAFVDQVQDLTSLTVSDTDELSQFLKDGVIDVTNRWLAIRPQDIELFIRVSGEQTANDSLALNGVKIINVIREDGTNNQWRNCRKISPALQTDVTDEESLNYASKINPVYTLLHNGKINVFPSADVGGANSFKVYYVNNEPTDLTNNAALIHSHSDIQYFPADKVYLVIMYAGIKLIHATLAAKSAPSVPVSQVLPVLSITATDPTAISLTTVNYNPVIAASSTVLSSLTAPTYTKPTTALTPAPSLTTVVFTSIDSALDANAPVFSTAIIGAASTYTGSAPTYTKPVLVLGTAPTISNLSITAVPPDTPTLSESSVTITGTAPVYTAPTITASSTELTEMEALTGTALGTDADFIDFEMWFAALGEMIEDEEDTELAQAQIGKISTYLQAYSQAMQNQLNIFNDANAEYQAILQKNLKDADIDNQEDARLVQKYQAELAVYQAEVGAQVQEYQQNLAGDIQVWQGERTTDLQKYATDVQNEVNEFNKENVAYQSAIQESVQELQVANQVNLAKAQTDLQLAIANEDRDQQRQLQNGVNDMKAIVDDNSRKIASWQGERQTDIQKYSADIQNELNEFNKENASFGYEVQKALADAQATNQVAINNRHQEDRAAIENNNAQVQRFQSMAQHYASQVNEDIQKYTVQVQALTADIQASVAEHGSELQGTQAEYQWLQDQYTRLKAEYDQAFMIAAPKQQAAPQAARQRR